MKKIIHSDAAPGAIGPYSQAVRAGDFLFISGQLGIDPAAGKLPDTVTDQARCAMENMGAILNEADLNFSHVVKVTILLADIGDFAVVNEVYAGFFTGAYPARAAYAVANLPRGALVEIEAIAYAG